MLKRLTGRFTGIDIERMRHVLLSLPHYFKELAKIRRLSELYAWMYLKFPSIFPLMEFPPFITVEPTNKCNFSCKHCPRSIMDRPLGSMEVEVFEKIVREVSLHKSVQALKLRGSGEPAIHPRFRELMAVLDHQAALTVVYTNGSLLQLYPHREILSWGWAELWSPLTALMPTLTKGSKSGAITIRWEGT